VNTRATQYVWSVIVAAGLVCSASLAGWTLNDPQRFAMYLAVALAASAFKLRLPGIDGTYSLNFLFILVGVACFSLPETLVAGCGAALVQSLFRAQKRPTWLQLLFNVANLSLSIAAAFLIARKLPAAGLVTFRPALLALAACAYFVVNTILVSGVLSLLQGEPLRQVSRQWYLWSFPYYLVGAALVNLLPLQGQSVRPEAWLILLPITYLLHFFYGLGNSERRPATTPEVETVPFEAAPRKVYVTGVITAGLVLAGAALFCWHTADTARFAGYLLAAVIAATWKVRLPGMTSTLSVGFVMTLVAVAELGFAEAVLIGGASAVAQCVWKPRVRPSATQIAFNFGSMTVGAAASWATCHLALGLALNDFLPAVLVAATAVLYLTATLLMAGVLRLVERAPAGIWQRCYFWSFPYYLVGAAVAGIIIAAERAAGWQTSLLVLPVMALVYISYRLHVTKAAEA
jgi:hypothetical protein